MPTLSLKMQNTLSQTSLIAISCSIAWVSAYGIDALKTIKNHYELFGSLAALSPIIALLAHLIPAEIKHSMIFGRVTDALPGHRFIQLVKKDPRLSMNDLIAHFANRDLSNMSEKAQNIFWYKEIYRPNQEDTQVKSAHRMFLLYRDTACALFILSVITIFLFLRGIELFDHKATLGFAVAFLAQYTLVVIAAMFAGKRMVTNAACALLRTKIYDGQKW